MGAGSTTFFFLLRQTLASMAARSPRTFGGRAAMGRHWRIKWNGN